MTSQCIFLYFFVQANIKIMVKLTNVLLLFFIYRKIDEPCCEVYNLGLGRGYSVLEMIEAVHKVSGKPVPYKIVGRRAGDVATVYSDPSKAKRELGWVATRDLETMCRDLWNWQQKNPEGFTSSSSK